MQDEDELFQQAMAGVKPLAGQGRADVGRAEVDSPGIRLRRQAAVALAGDSNYLSSSEIEMLSPHDQVSFRRAGIQHGVFKKLRLGRYQIESRLDLHKMSVDHARNQVFNFIRDARANDLRSLLLVHGKGRHNEGQSAVLKSYCVRWLEEIPEVMAFHSAQRQHGGNGALYVLLQKSDRLKQENRERYGHRADSGD